MSELRNDIPGWDVPAPAGRDYHACCEHCDCKYAVGHAAPCLQCQIPWHAGADLDDEGLVRYASPNKASPTSGTMSERDGRTGLEPANSGHRPSRCQPRPGHAAPDSSTAPGHPELKPNPGPQAVPPPAVTAIAGMLARRYSGQPTQRDLDVANVAAAAERERILDGIDELSDASAVVGHVSVVQLVRMIGDTDGQ